MFTKRKIILFLLVLIIVSGVGYFLTKSPNEETIQTGIPTTPSSKVPSAGLNLPTGETITVSGVPVKNVYKTAITVNNDGDTLFAETNNYQQIYQPKQEFFLISITRSPFEEARREAEAQFLKSLGITEEEACKLKVTITTPAYANPDEAGKNYKLSFCG